MLVVCQYGLPASAGNKQKKAPSDRVASSSPTCTDLAGAAVACPAGHDGISLSERRSGSANLRRLCVDLLGDELPCPGEAIEPQSVAIESQREKPVARDGSPSEPRAVSRPSSKDLSESSCLDLLGEPVSCPIDVSTTGVESNASAEKSICSADRAGIGTATTVSTSNVYVEPSQRTRSWELSFPRDIFVDQKEFWATPLHLRLDDAYWGVPFGIISGGLIAADTSIEKQLPTSPNTIKHFKQISDYGVIAYGGLVAGSYLLGKAGHNSYLSDTAWLAGEAGVNSFISTSALKYAFGRERPMDGNGQGDFFSG